MPIDLECVVQLHDFLMGGDPPSGIHLRKRPRKMTAEQSFSVIYVLQEAFRLIPDAFELCGVCGRIFDTNSEGHITPNGKFYCWDCCHLCECSECKRLLRRSTS